MLPPLRNSKSEAQRVGQLKRHLPVRLSHHPHALEVLDHPVWLGRHDLFHSVARYQSQDLAPGRFSSLDACWAVLENKDLPGLVLQPELLEADEVAGRIGFAVLDRLRGNEMLRSAKRQPLQPAPDQGLGARRDDGPGEGNRDDGGEERAGAGDLHHVVGVPLRELSLHFRDICGCTVSPDPPGENGGFVRCQRKEFQSV